MEHNSAVVKTSVRSLEINKVLKNTYLLLSATLLFSAGTAALAIYMNAGIMNFWLYIALFIGLSYGVHKTADSSAGLFMVFALTGFLGFYTGPIISIYAHQFGSGLVMNALGGTGLIFFALSGYVLTTKKDFTFMRGFLFAGIVVVLLAFAAYLVAHYLFDVQLQALSLGISSVLILLMSGYILYDTSSIIRGEQTNYIRATTSMYLNIWILFMNLMRLLAFFAGDD